MGYNDRYRGGGRGGRGYDRNYKNSEYDERGYDYDNGQDYGRNGNYYRGRQSGSYQRGRSSTYRGRRPNDRRGGGRQYHQQNTLPQAPNIGVKPIANIAAHKKRVSTVIVEWDKKQAYTGGGDGTLKKIDFDKEQELHSQDMPGPVHCLLGAGSMLVCGMDTWHDRKGVIKVINMETGSEQELLGHEGQVLCLTQLGESMLASGGQDKTIRVWQYDSSTGLFSQVSVIGPSQNGHNEAIQTMELIPLGNTAFLFSFDLSGCIKVWSTNFECVQTVQIESPSPAILSMVLYGNDQGKHVITGSADGCVRVWELNPQPQMGAVMSAQPIHTHPQQPEEYPMVLSLAGIAAWNRELLMVGYSDESKVLLYDLPEFKLAGELRQVYNANSIHGGPEGMILTADETGGIRVFQLTGKSRPSKSQHY